MHEAHAQDLAIKIFTWMIEDEDRLMSFLSLTGADISDLRESAEDPAFLGFVLDFILSDDQTVLAAASSLSIPPDHIQQARFALPGGDVPNWT